MNKKQTLFKKQLLSQAKSEAKILAVLLIFSLTLLGGCSGKESAGADMDIENPGTEISDAETSDAEISDTELPDVKQSAPGSSDMEQSSEEVSDTVQPEKSVETEQTQENDLCGYPTEAAFGLEGKKLSIVGDSISTFDGWTPEGYSDFFPMDGAVADVEQTWWKMLLNDTGMSLCVNASSSGSTCAGYSPGTDSPQEGCNDFRINGLADANGNSPDIIIVYMGSNDFIRNIPLGDNDGTRKVEEGNVENFSDAYCLMLDKLHARYPDAKIFCCNLLPIGGIGESMTYEPFTNKQGLHADSYSRLIETIASAKGYPVIDLEHCGITIESLIQYTGDGLHPNPEGMKLIRDAVKAAVTDQ